MQLAIRVPPAALADSAGNLVGTAEVARLGELLTLNGRLDWASAGLAPISSVRVVQVTTDTFTHRLHVGFDGVGFGHASLSISLRDTAFALAALFAPASDSAEIQATLNEALRTRVFSGPLASISAAGQQAILTEVKVLVDYGPVPIVRLDDRPYLVLPTRESTYTCAIGATTDPERQIEAIKEAALPIAFNLGAADTAMTGPFGFAIRVFMKVNYSCSNGLSPDEVTIYLPADVARQFAAGRITPQQTVTQSVVLFDGSRVKAPQGY